MKYVILVILVAQSLILNAQFKKVYFLITPKIKPNAGALYNEIEVLDLRKDTADLGLVEGWGPPSVVVPTVSLQVQLSNVVASRVDSAGTKGKLLFVLRRFQFSKPPGRDFLSLIYLQGDMFQVDGNSLLHIASYNQGRSFKPSVTIDRLMKYGADIMTNFIDSMIVLRPQSAQLLTFHQAMNIDSVQKSNLKVYNTRKLTNGLYKTWQEFASQQPSTQRFELRRELNEVTGVVTSDENGREVMLPEDKYFAVVENGIPYAACEYGLFQMKKVNNEFFFNAVAKKFNGRAFANHGLIGGMAAGPDVRVIRYVLNPSEGKFLRALDKVNMN